MTRTPLWTPEEAREDAEREGEPERKGGCLFELADLVLRAWPFIIILILRIG